MIECVSRIKYIPYGTLSTSKRSKMDIIKEPRKLLLICIYVLIISIIAYMAYDIYDEHKSIHKNKTMIVEIVNLDDELEDNIYYIDPVYANNDLKDNLDLKYT